MDLIPEGVPVSATNEAGSHLSARERIHLFPKLRDAQYVLYAEGARSRAMARDRPTLRPLGTYKKLQLLRDELPVGAACSPRTGCCSTASVLAGSRS